MNKLKKFILLNFVLLLASCGTMQGAFENQKKNNTDEFLVEKKQPLVMPPDFEKLPIPDQNQLNNQQENISQIEELIVRDNTANTNSKSSNNSNKKSRCCNTDWAMFMFKY